MSYQWEDSTMGGVARLDYLTAQRIAEQEASLLESFLANFAFYDQDSPQAYSYEPSKENHELLTSLYVAFLAKRFGIV